MAIELRGYQLLAIEACIKEQSNGIHRQLIVLPTGTGKTFLFAGLTHRLNKRTWLGKAFFASVVLPDCLGPRIAITGNFFARSNI